MSDPARPGRHTEVLRITQGSLGPVCECCLEIRPLTVFIGKQGTGKSLLAHLLYIFEELPFLTRYINAKPFGGSSEDPDQVFNEILRRLQVPGSFFGKQTEVRWGGLHSCCFLADSDFGQVRLSEDSAGLVKSFCQPEVFPKRHAIFIPAERVITAQLHSPLAINLLSFPLTWEMLMDWLTVARRKTSEGGRGLPILTRKIDRIGRRALGGHTKWTSTQWKWCFRANGKARSCTLDSASTGQRANWMIPYLARAAVLMQEGTPLTLFVEDPELHLHPEAQREIAIILALLINSGIRIVVTTHSLVLLYTLNNLMAAHKQLGLAGVSRTDLPSPDIRLNAENVSVYSLDKAGAHQLVDRETAFIDEHAPGQVGEDLSDEMNHIMAYGHDRKEPL